MRSAISASVLFAGSASAGGFCPADVTGDGEVNGADLSVVLGGWGQPGASDINGDGNTDGTDLGLLLGSWGPCPEAPVEISVAVGAEAISFTEGGSVGLAYTIEVSGIGDAAVVLEVSQLSLPSGLSIVNDVPEGGFIALSDGVFVFNMLVGGATPGAFSIETDVQPSEGDAASVSLPVAVLPLAGIPELSPLAVEPAAVNPETPTSVVFSVTLSGTSVPPAEFTLARTQPDGTPIAFPTTLRDDGVAPDLSAGDGVYSGQVVVNAGPAEDARFYKAFESVPLAGGVLETPLYELNVTPYPVGPSPSDPGSVVDGPGGAPVYSNEVIMFFAPGTSDARIAEIVDLFDGTIVGSVPATGAYQVSFPGDGTFAGVQAVIAQMKTVVDVDIVEPLFPITTTELVPNDPLWPTQIGVAAIRATEAWTVATGEVVIAIVDTGVDPTHPDFQLASGGSKVIVLPGSDVLDGDDDPGDPDGHGTRMAGIAAAIGNNGLGIAGVAWRSPILAVRAFGEGSSDLTLAQGIVFAAVNGARVINVSGGLEAPTVVLEDAIEYARERGCLIVASAGNQIDGTNVTTYPCAFAGVLCVGAVDNAGAPLAGANVSLSIDLVAPGEAVPTTVAGGGYGTSSGTSAAAAMVAGSAAVVWSVDPTVPPSVIEERLVAGAAPLPPSVLDPADGRLDLFESTFDGSFELPTLALWSTEGTVSVLESLGRLIPTDRMRMAYVSTGPAGAGVAASLRKDFVVQPGVTMFAITFDYDFVTEEWPEYVGTEFNDSLRIVLVEPDGAEVLLAIETINDSVFFPIEGIDFPGGDDTVGHTGWKTVTAVVPITKGPGSYTVRIEDAGDDEYDSVALVDRIRLVGDPQALYCGAPEAGDCCEANPTPFCADGDCCNTVCLIDPTCCQTEWDQACALLATQVCAGCAPEVEICDNGIDDDGDSLVDCDDPDCAASPDCTKSGFCGDPQSGDCCEANGTPFCSDATCCETVCAADNFCCATEWDQICAQAAAKLCGGLCGGGAQEICDNGIDDDGDGLVDCDDPECKADPDCQACSGGLTDCNGECVDLATDLLNCGDCGVVCDDGDPCTVDTCVDGQCFHTPIDADGDGYAPIACGGGDCDDGDPNVNPGAKELCSDGIDNDCDGLVDCDDPDCASFPGCGGGSVEVCDNGIDDDADGLVDCDDPDCAAFPACIGDECSVAIAIEPGVPVFIDTTAATGSIEPVDDSQCPDTFLDWGTPGTNPDVWLAWTPTGSGLATFSTCDAAGFDTSMVLYEGSCGALTQVACNGDSAGGAGCQQYYSQIDYPVTQGVTYYVRIGGYLGATGTNTVTLEFLPVEICDNGIDDDGDGLIDCEDPDCASFPGCGGGQEICDDGIDNDGDGLVDCADPDCSDSAACCPDGLVTYEMGDLTLAGNAISTLGFNATGSPSEVSISFEFVGNTSGSWASDLVLVIDDGVNPPVYWGGFNTSFNGVVNGGAWPFDGEGSAASGPYSGTVSVPTGFLALSGEFTIGVGNGWTQSPEVQYLGVKVTLNGLCGDGPEICDNGIDDDGDGLVDCDDPDCAAFPGCAKPEGCGDPVAGDCCEANGTPFCSDAACCEMVCAADAFCCATEWDTLCAGLAVNLCDGLCGGGGDVELCDNGVDDDGDGLVDCDDPDCVEFGDCSPQDWATVLEFEPDPAVVTDPETVAAIIATGLPWRVRDNVTQIEMLLVPAGTFVMGCSPSLQSGCSGDENPPHQVVLTRPFYLGRYEVTQAEWTAVMGTNPSAFQGQADSPQRPVENISWDRVTQFKAASGLRLPTEAEWEYACRAGTGTAYHHSTSDAALLSEVAWFAGNNSPAGTKAVGQKAANAWGFHDMHGNVYEWCEDWYSETYYASSPTVDPTGPASGTSKVMRSGFFNAPASGCRSSTRSKLLAGGLASFYNGFRVARYPAAGTETCDNGVDDDGDGLVDCDDPDCAGVPGCCPDGQVICGDACVDLSSDPVNCGDCGVVCDDGDPCTVDTCVDGVCVHTPIVCEDGDPCTVDTCVDGECVHTPIVCEDGDPCTVDECVDGECVHTPVDADGDGYAPIACGGGDCDDGNPDVNPGAKELCGDGIDNDCDGLVDCDDPDCADFEGCQPLDWATVLEFSPDPEVITDPEWRERIIATGLPWRVRDNASGIEMLLVPPGTFMMGCSPSDQYECSLTNENPVHQVTLTSAFYLGRYEVTQAQWMAVMGSNPSLFQSASAQVPAAQVPNRPVERVSWNMIQNFEAATGLRLPTEAQWEYACRAGTQTAFNLVPDGTNVDSQFGLLAWYSSNSSSQTRPVGQKLANNLGLHDMHGNVREWCEDWYGFDYYSVSPLFNPTGPISGAFRVFRGGNWGSDSGAGRASWRGGNVPGFDDFFNGGVGFRVRRSP